MSDNDGGYIPAGEDQGQNASFSAEALADAFAVEVERVHRAIRGELGVAAEGSFNSRQAQRLAEVLLGDQPLDKRQAALLRLGAFTPRPDQEWGLGETVPGEESDRFAASADALEDEAASKRSSHDPGQRTG